MALDLGGCRRGAGGGEHTIVRGWWWGGVDAALCDVFFRCSRRNFPRFPIDLDN